MMYYYSKRGISHEKNGIANQDAAFAMSYDGVNALAVADGVGSCVKADIGSNFIVRFMCNYACYHFEELERMSNWEIQKVIIENFKVNYPLVEVDDALSTLLLVACKGSKVLFLQIGDGKILLVSKYNSSQVFPDDGLPMNKSYTWNSNPCCFCKMILDGSFFNMDYILLCTDGVYKPDKAPVEFNNGLSYMNEAFVLELYQRHDPVGYQNFINTVVRASDGHYGDFDDKTAGLMVLR